MTLSQPPISAQRIHQRVGEGEKSQQVAGARQSRARDWRYQENLWLSEGPIPDMAKNLHRLEAAAAPAKLFIVRRRLLHA